MEEPFFVFLHKLQQVSFMKKRKGHSFFCRCHLCKQKRLLNPVYLFFILFFLIIIFYQAFLLIFLTTKIHAILLFIEFLMMMFLISLVLL